MSSPCVVLADDHPLFREALHQAVRTAQPSALVREVGDASGLIRLLETIDTPALLLLDLGLPDASGMSALVHVTSHHPSLAVAVVSASDGMPVIERAAAYGARGFIPKSSGIRAIVEAVRALLEGKRWFPPGLDVESLVLPSEEAVAANRLAGLSPQQYRIALMLSEGKLNKQIAYDLDIAEATVKVHVSSILRKLGLVNRTQVATLVSRLSNFGEPQRLDHAY